MQGETEKAYNTMPSNTVGSMKSESKLNQPIDHFFKEHAKHEENMIENHKSLSNLLYRLDTVANRLAPQEYYQNTPQPINDSKPAPEELPFSFPHGGIYSGLNEVMQSSRVQESELTRQIDELRRKVQFFEQFI